MKNNFTTLVNRSNIYPDVHTLFGDFIEEVKDLEHEGYTVKNEVYPFIIRNFICDAPARSLSKCTIGHTGYGSCEKCTVYGEYVDNRVTFADLDAPLRTDESFRLKSEPHHHTGTYPLEEIAGLVSQFRLDSMHLVDEGCFKRLLDFWKNIPGSWKLHRKTIAQISTVLLSLVNFCPTDFNRPPRSLEESCFYKATEYNLLLKYDGILVFKDLVDESAYNHFLLLHSGIFILSSPFLIRTLRDYAHQLLRTFVEHSVKLYGKRFVVYNVHALIHLADECGTSGCLDEFSAYPYENKLKSIKQTLGSGYLPLAQVAQKDMLNTKAVKLLLPSDEVTVKLEGRHNLEDILDGVAYKKVIIKGITFKIGKRDSCFKTNNDEVIVLENVILREGEVFLIGCSFREVKDFYDYPLPSSSSSSQSYTSSFFS